MFKNKNFKGLIETIKTIALTAFIAGVVAFIGGVHYQQGADQRLMDAKAVTTAPASK